MAVAGARRCQDRDLDDEKLLVIYYDYMKARVYVSFKATVLDPQGQTIQRALNGLGHTSIAGVRQGKFFDIEIAPGADARKPRAK